MIININKLNKSSNGSLNHLNYSNKAEKSILDTLNLTFNNKFKHIFSDSVQYGDFIFNNNELGDIKIQSSRELCIELNQMKKGKITWGWFFEYCNLVNMKWLLFINRGFSNHYGKVWKVRFIPFILIDKYLQDHYKDEEAFITKERSTLYYIDPVNLKNDGWIGHFHFIDKKTFDSNKFFPNPLVQI